MTDLAKRPSGAYARHAPLVVLGVALVGVGLWMLLRGRSHDFEDIYADPLGTGYPPNLPSDFYPSPPVKDAA